MAEATSNHWLRDRDGEDSAKVTTVELFFDLVFVFAITQLSHILFTSLTAEGAMRTLLLFLAVWWVWIYTAWVTNWLNPERVAVRALLFALMFAGLVMSVSLPDAFGERGLSFALAYAAMQVGRSFFMLWAMTRAGHDGRANFQRITAWLGLSGLLWLGGAFLENDARYLVWAAALLAELLSPSIGFWVPGLGRSSPEDWDVEGPHLAERCGLFIIIALGESLLVTGRTLEDLPLDRAHLAGLVVALLGAVAMWWVYFDTGAKRGEKALERAETPGRLAQMAYTYLHMPIVAGIVVTAVSDELVVAHPSGLSDWRIVATTLGGPALFLLGNLLFKAAVTGRLPVSHLLGLGLLGALLPVSFRLDPLLVSALTVVALAAVALAERRLARSLEAAQAGVA